MFDIIFPIVMLAIIVGLSVALVLWLRRGNTETDSPPLAPALSAPTEHPWLTSLTPGDIREIGDRYGLKLTGKVDTTLSRAAVFAAGIIVALYLSTMVVGFVTRIVGLNYFPYLHLLVLAGTVLLTALSLPLFFVNVPKVTGLIVTSYFGGVLHVFGPGIHIKFPWEHYTMEDFIDIRAISVEKKSRFIAKLINERGEVDGAIGLTFQWTVQYGPFLLLLALYVRTEEKAIEDGFKEVVENALNEAISTTSLDKMLEKDTIDELQEKLRLAFRGSTASEKDDLGSTLEERFGIQVELNTLGPPDFDQDYTEALSGQVIRRIVMSDAKRMSDELKISGEKAMDNVLIINKEGVTKNIWTIQADENMRDVAQDMGKIIQAAGPIVQAVRGPRPPKKK